MIRCRICLLKIENDCGRGIFEFTINNELLSTIIANVANIEVTKHPDFPHSICPSCWRKLRDTYHFRTVIIKSDAKLRQELYLKEISCPRNVNEAEESPDQKNSIASNSVSAEKEIEQEQSSQLELNEIDADLGDTDELEEPDNKGLIDVQISLEIGQGLEESSDHSADIQTKNFVEDKFKLTCQECNRSFKKLKYLQIHQKRHTNGKPFRCEVCHKDFATNQELNIHKRKHSDELPFICETCGKGFKFSSTLRLHCKGHQNLRPHECDVCNKSFRQTTGLKNHKAMVHGTERNFICERCSLAFKVPGALQKHIRKIHDRQIKMENCPVCNLACAHSHLKKHMATHSNEKPFECSACQKRFLSKYAFTMHSKRVHEQLKPYECEVCAKRFPLKYERLVHMRVHTKERPFSCSECEKAFSFRHHLRRHVDRVHPNPSRNIDGAVDEENG